MSDQLRELQERAFQLEELRKHPGWAVLEEYVGQVSAVHQRRVLTGCKTFDEYQYEVGFIRGAELAIHAASFALQLLDSHEESDAAE